MIVLSASARDKFVKVNCEVVLQFDDVDEEQISG